MRNEARFSCCGSMISGQRCRYCGFVNVAALDNEAENEIRKEAEEHRKEMLGQLLDFSIVGYEYGWIEAESKFDLISQKNIRIADGNDCANGVFWSQEKFGQDLEDSSESKQIEIAYKYEGDTRKVSCDIAPVSCDDFWQIGLEITPELRLVVYLGNQKKSAKSEPVDLRF